LEQALGGATVESAVFNEWRTLRNSELLKQAHDHGFTALLTSDKRLAREQSQLPMAVIAVDDNRLKPLLEGVHDIARAIRETPAGSFQSLEIGS
jgi:hypothetical protein